METKQLEKMKNVKNSVIATGGGIILKNENQIILKEIGRWVYLKVPYSELLKRLVNDRNRPLIKEKNPEEVLKEMFKERCLIYEQAECIIETGLRSPQQIASQIITKLGNEERKHNF